VGGCVHVNAHTHGWCYSGVSVKEACNVFPSMLAVDLRIAIYTLTF